ncbi:autism susceptibility gene 2 protein homolog isoform X4 [Latimeria chalumnae]|uniref:autism susceptibility gene 2 protein homolog isoform X4 n=1 Tax=Latimeria chalumnae TaxID=7897 RepID=UPI00313F3719
MEGKMRQSRRSRSQRDRVRRRESGARDARNQSPSSGSERERSPGKEQGSPNCKLPPNPPPPARNPRPPRRKRRESSSQEEDIIDGFAIASFNSLDALEKDLSLKPQERREKWEKHSIKRRRELESIVSAELSESMHNDAGSSEREQDRGKERVKKKLPPHTPSAGLHCGPRQTKVSSNRGGRNSEEDSIREATSSQRSSSRGCLSDSSVHSFSGKGYSCDSESDLDDKASDVGSEKLFSPAPSKGVTSNDKPEVKATCDPKISGLERSQEQSTEVPFVPLESSPLPFSIVSTAAVAAAVVTTSTTTAPASSTPASSTRASPAVKKEPVLPAPAPPRVTPQPELRRTPPAHIPPPANYQLHCQLPYSVINNISRSRSSSASSNTSISLPKHLPPSPQIPPIPQHHSSTPALPLSISNLATSHYSLRPQTNHHHHPPAMFAAPTTLPPPPALPTNGLVMPGHPAGPGYSDTSLLISFNQPIMYCQPHSGILIGTLSQASLLPPPMSPHVENHHSITCRNRECQFDKYGPKLDSPFFRHSNFFSSYPPTMPGISPMLPHSGPFGSLQGAFQPKTSNPIDVASRPGALPHTLLQKDPRKPGKWCAVHVQIAWQIYHHQQKMKQMQLEPHKLDMNGKLDLFSRPPGPTVFPGFPYPHDLARPLFSSTGTVHPAAGPFGASPHHSSFLPTAHLAGRYPFSRSNSFSSLGSLNTNAFGGLANHNLAPNSVFANKEGPCMQNFGSPHEPWNRLHRTPPSFPTPPQWPKLSDSDRSSSATNHDRDRERERELEKRDSSVAKEERDKERDGTDKNRHSNRSSPASAPVSHQISNLIRSNSQTSSDSLRQSGSNERDRPKEPERELQERLRELPTTEHKIKESRSPVKESPCHERRSSEDNTKPVIRSASPYVKPILSDGVKFSNSMSKEAERKSELHSDLQKVKNDVKVKEERKEDSDVMVVGSETSQHPRNAEHVPPSSLHGLPLPHSMATSMPVSMSSVHQMNSISPLDRARMVNPLMNINHMAARERVPHPGLAWDPLRESLRDAYRNLDLHRRMDFQLRTDPVHRFPSAVAFYEHERSYRDREPHDYNHENILEARREQERLRHADERERLHLREEIERARLHHLHSSAIESHLAAHVPSFMPHLGGMHYPRLSPSSAVHNGILNRTPPTAALSAPPPLVPASSTRPTSPRRTTPLTNSDPRDYSPSRNPKEVEAR